MRRRPALPSTISNSKWTTQDGANVALASFAGRPVVAAMGYTTCKDICPAIVADMMWIEKHLPSEAAGRVRFAFFSFDPEADTPERLKLYADGHGLDLGRWTLLRADDDAVRELAAALGVGYKPDGQGGFDHAAVISLLDRKGRDRLPAARDAGFVRRVARQTEDFARKVRRLNAPQVFAGVSSSRTW